MNWLAWWPTRNIPRRIRRLGPPHHTAIMNAIADMLDGDRRSTTDRDQLLNEALELLKQAARLEDR